MLLIYGRVQTYEYINAQSMYISSPQIMLLPILFVSDFFSPSFFVCVYVRSIFWNIKSHFSVWPQYSAGCSVSADSEDGEVFHKSGNRGVFLSQPSRKRTDTSLLKIHISFRRMCILYYFSSIYTLRAKIYDSRFWNVVSLLKSTLNSENKRNVICRDNFLGDFLGGRNKVRSVEYTLSLLNTGCRPGHFLSCVLLV